MACAEGPGCLPREPGALAISHSSPTPSSPPRAGTIDRPDRLDLDLWLWPLGGWTALRGLPWPHPTGPEKTLDWLRASLSRRGSRGCLVSQPHWREQSWQDLPLPSLLSDHSCRLPLGGERKLGLLPCAPGDRQVLWCPPISHMERQACLGGHWGQGRPQPSCL